MFYSILKSTFSQLTTACAIHPYPARQTEFLRLTHSAPPGSTYQLNSSSKLENGDCLIPDSCRRKFHEEEYIQLMNLNCEKRKRVPSGILASSSIVFGILYLSIAVIHILDRYLDWLELLVWDMKKSNLFPNFKTFFGRIWF